jgi:hypothetical protein
MLEDTEAVSLLLDVDNNAEPHSTSMAGSGSAAAGDIETSDLLIDIGRNKTPPYSDSENLDVETIFHDIVVPVAYNPKDRFYRARRILTRILLIISFSTPCLLDSNPHRDRNWNDHSRPPPALQNPRPCRISGSYPLSTHST